MAKFLSGFYCPQNGALYLCSLLTGSALKRKRVFIS